MTNWTLPEWLFASLVPLMVAFGALLGSKAEGSEARTSLTLFGQASIIDADTLEIQGRRIRLHGIDAPESSQLCQDEGGHDYRCGQRAALALADKITGRTVSCTGRDVDRYGRLIAVCRSDDEDLNGWLVASGLAIAYRRFSMDYAKMEDAARGAKRGIWAGRFLEPEHWRQRQ